MYGTVARMRLKPGMEAKVKELMKKFEGRQVPGFIGQYIYRMDQDPNEYYMAVLFTNKEAYSANADSPEQDAEYRKLLELLEGEPEWHDGEVVFLSVSAQGWREASWP